MRRFFLALSASVCFASSAFASDIPEGDVVVTIKPLYSLVASIMEGAGTPTLLLDGHQSPHDFQLKPSHIAQLSHAKEVFYVGSGYETFLQRALKTLPKTTHATALSETPMLKHYAVRQHGIWEEDEHAHGHDAADEHEKEHKEEHNTQHEHLSNDLHVWLDPNNARFMAKNIANILVQQYPAARKTLQANAEKLDGELAALDQELSQQFSAVKDTPFIVFHDATQYLEKRYQLNAQGSITLEPNSSPSAKRLSEIQTRLRQGNIRCIFKEPFFSDKLITTLTGGMNIRTATLDPEATALDANATLYPTLMRSLASSITHCLQK